MGWAEATDNRAARRVAAEWPMQFQVVLAGGSLQAPVHTLTTSVSMAGLAFVSPISMPVNTRLEMSVSVPRLDDELVVSGIIRRVTAGAEAGAPFEYGVAFDPVPECEALAHFVRATDITPLLESVVAKEASALYLAPDNKPLLRTADGLEPAHTRVLTRSAVDTLVQGLLAPKQRGELRKARQLVFNHPVPGLGRWRVHVNHQGGALAATFFRVQETIPSLDDLGLPKLAGEMVAGPGGLVLVCGPAGSGKGATLAALVHHVRRLRGGIVATVESPVEFLHGEGPGLVSQREVGADVASIADGLKHGVWQGADALMVSDLTEPAGMDAALDYGAAGRLVLGGYGAADPLIAIDRIAEQFPQRRRENVLHRLASALRGLIGQRRVPRKSADGSVAIYESFRVTDGIRQAIRNDKLDQVPILLEATGEAYTLEHSLRAAVARGDLDYETAANIARAPEHLRRS